MLKKFVILALLALTVTAINLPGIPLEFTEDDQVISAISGGKLSKIVMTYHKKKIFYNKSKKKKK